MRRWRATLVLFCAVLLLAAVSCTQEQYPSALYEAQHPATANASPSPAPSGACRQAFAQPLPQRSVAMSTQVASASFVSTSDLYTEYFSNYCNPCHVTSNLGSFQVPSATAFAALSASQASAMLSRMTSNGPTNPSDPNDPNDPLDPMPPIGQGGKPFSERTSTDGIYQFVQRFTQWLALGQPSSFQWPPPAGDASAPDAGSSAASLTMSSDVGMAMTNLGNCIPDAALVAQAASQQKAADLDAMFARATPVPPALAASGADIIGLPEHLSDTDLFTFDSATLAQYRVIAFQPAYPLWSDDAGKLRYVRVPVGQSITFNKETQEFDIPDNTRFYKTFMKRVIDRKDGSVRWHKIETRLILVRHNTPNPGNTAQPYTVNALFGSYQYNSDESDATLVDTPLIDTLPFADTLFEYDEDEPMADLVRAGNPGANQDLALLAAQAVRHYAIPSSERCIQCHEGSPSQTFILGFRPVQVNRRPAGEGGTLVEPGQGPPTADELSQLQRLIDYGVITGLTPADVLPLEASEGARTPRNDYELRAQGYMVGNCAHCHNPRGYPSVQFPVLANTLIFLPGSGPNQGIFQFPLEKYSPRISRGAGGSGFIPYISPSLMDVADPLGNYQSVTPGQTPPSVSYAPWRSLIYRNTDTPFTYTEDSALYPHMPMNTPGYDCRVKQIMSDWMVSIPGVRKNPQIAEYAIRSTTIAGISSVVDNTPQPYVEVLPTASGYADAVRAANDRLAVLHTGVNPALETQFVYSRYADCVDTSDILDPLIQAEPTCYSTPPPVQVASLGLLSTINSEGTPGHAHWTVTDLSQIPPPWNPRRPDWASVLIDQQFPPPATPQANCPDGVPPIDPATLALAVGQLQTPVLDDVRAFALQPFPMGLWQQQAGCDFSSEPKVSDYTNPANTALNVSTGGLPPRWLVDNPSVHASPSDPVYAELPGAAVFNQICINCHGPLADGSGRLASNLETITGGKTRVADLRDGLFGPVDNPGWNRQNAANGFGFVPTIGDAGADVIAKWSAITTDDRAARYLAFMGLGGTLASIPKSILQIVANTSVLGVTPVIDPNLITPNMLAVAQATCNHFIGSPSGSGLAVNVPAWFVPDGDVLQGNKYVVTQNGHAELWLAMCSLDNAPPIRAVDAEGMIYSEGDLFPESVYPAGAPIGNDRGGTDNGVLPTNLFPWCLRRSKATLSINNLTVTAPPSWPICPDVIDDGSTDPADEALHGGSSSNAYLCTNGCWAQGRSPQLGSALPPDPIQVWATHGAINAAFSVFLYLDAIERDPTKRLPDYDQCTLLGADAGASP